MDIRLLEIVMPGEALPLVEKALHGRPILSKWHDRLTGGEAHFHALVAADQCEAMIDVLEKTLEGKEFRVLLLSVEASVPRPKEPEPPPAPPKEEPRRAGFLRISREELYADIEKTCRLNLNFLVMVILSSIVACIGLLRDSAAVVIGAMVIAPLLGPNVTLAFGTTLGDGPLVSRALRVNGAGVLLALAFATGVGLFFDVDTSLPEIASRTRVDVGDVVLALASGVAGTLAFTTGAPSSLIGVMVAVALLPPLAVFGMLLGDGQPRAAAGAALLLATNVVCINLAGVSTFLAQGIRPRRWWEEERAKRATRLALVLWTGLLASLVLLIQLARSR